MAYQELMEQYSFDIFPAVKLKILVNQEPWFHNEPVIQVFKMTVDSFSSSSPYLIKLLERFCASNYYSLTCLLGIQSFFHDHRRKIGSSSHCMVRGRVLLHMSNDQLPYSRHDCHNLEAVAFLFHSIL